MTYIILLLRWVVQFYILGGKTFPRTFHSSYYLLVLCSNISWPFCGARADIDFVTGKDSLTGGFDLHMGEAGMDFSGVYSGNGSFTVENKN